MKVLLVQSYLGDYPTLVFPLGLSYLRAALAQHEVEVLDLNVLPDPYHTLPERIRAFQPEVIGLSLRNIDDQMRKGLRYFYRENFQQELAVIRQVAPDTPLVVGGAGFSLFAREIMVENPQIDLGVYLEGEEAFPELLANLTQPERVQGVFYRHDGQVHFTGVRSLVDFARLPAPDRSLLDTQGYPGVAGVAIQTARGCPHACVYCTYPQLGGCIPRIRSAEQVVEEIAQLVSRGVEEFFFADSVFGANLQQGRRICQLILEQGLPVRWGAYFDVNYGDDDFFRLAAKAGCAQFFFSPDGYSPQALRGLGKRLQPEAIDRNIRLFLQDDELAHAQVSYYFFLSPPGENLSGLGQTLWLYLRTYFKLKLKRRGHIGLNWIRIEPDTGLHRLAIEQGDLLPGQSLLPPAGPAPAYIFYQHPRLRRLDKPLLAAMEMMGWGKDLLKKVLGRG